MTKSWGQQCSPDCGCVVRFETTVDPVTQTIVDAKYVAKSVVTTIDKNNGGMLSPVLTTRTNKPMFQECSCQTVHTLSQQVTSYLPNKRMDQIRGMNDFTFTRSSPAFRHAVLAEHNLPRNDIHCFDVVEEAFTGMINKTIPGRRRFNADFHKLLNAECLEQPFIFHYSRLNNKYAEEHTKFGGRRQQQGRLGTDKNRLSLSSPKTMSTLRMFDINAEYWEEEEHAKDSAKNARNRRFDWVSYVDEMYENEESA
jgi:NifU-like protein involved in Fe-S cluster formation